jgi:hypothetical protein
MVNRGKELFKICPTNTEKLEYSTSGGRNWNRRKRSVLMNQKNVLFFIVLLVFVSVATVFAFDSSRIAEGYYHSRDRWSIQFGKVTSDADTYGKGQWLFVVRDSQGNKVHEGYGHFSGSGGTTKSFFYSDGGVVHRFEFTSATHFSDTKTGKGFSYSYGL